MAVPTTIPSIEAPRPPNMHTRACLHARTSTHTHTHAHTPHMCTGIGCRFLGSHASQDPLQEHAKALARANAAGVQGEGSAATTVQGVQGKGATCNSLHRTS
eukprot:1142768-Pelagomonas_calceolata.AAC.2